MLNRIQPPPPKRWWKWLRPFKYRKAMRAYVNGVLYRGYMPLIIETLYAPSPIMKMLEKRGSDGH